MSNVSIDSAVIQKLIKNCSDTITRLEKTRQGLLTKYQSLGSSWSDSKYQYLGKIIDECMAAISKVSNELQGVAQNLGLVNIYIREYESVDFSGSAGVNSLSEDFFGNLGLSNSSAGASGDCKGRCTECLKSRSCSFSKEAWEKLSSKQREKALNDLSKAAGKAFGIPIKGASFFEGSSNSRGYYNGDGYLYLNSDTLSNANNRIDALDTIFHEGRHAYQQSASENPEMYGISQETAEEWSHNFNPMNYIRPEDDLTGYFEQPIERDARSFAEVVITSGIDGGQDYYG